jgi:hypothetical protein
MKLLDQDPNFFESDAHAVPCPHQAASRAANVPFTSLVTAARRLSTVIEVPAHVPQGGFALAVLAGRHDRADAHVRAQREEGQQQAALEDITLDALVRGHRGELLGEPGQELGVLQHVQEVQDAPAAYDLVLEGLEAGGLGQRLQLRHGDPGLALAGGDLHPTRRAVRQRRREPVQGCGHALLQVLDERPRIQRLADRGVVHGAGGLEVTGQVVLRIAPAGRALDIDLATAHRVPQRHQHAQFVRDALDGALVIDDRLTPVLADHAVHRHDVRGVVEAGLAVDVGVLLQQLHRVHHRPVGSVVTSEAQCVQQRRQHLPVVRAVGGVQSGADLGFEHLLVRLRLGHQLTQRLLTHHREQGPADDLVGLVDGGRRQLEEDALLAADLLQLGRQLLLHPLLGTSVILWTRATRASLISACLDQHSDASSVIRTSALVSRKSEGYILIARARQAATSASPSSPRTTRRAAQACARR